MDKNLVESLRAKDSDLLKEAQGLERQVQPLIQRLNQINQARAGIQAILITEGAAPQMMVPQFGTPGTITMMPAGININTAFPTFAQTPPLAALVTNALSDGIPRTSAELATIAEKQGYRFEGKNGSRVVHTTMMGLRPKGQFIKVGGKWRLAPPLAAH